MVTLQTPITDQVNQRNAKNLAYVTVSGQCAQTADTIECRFVPITGGVAVIQQLVPVGGLFSGDCLVSGGQYALVVVELTATLETSRATLARVGVGEVFLISGHSVAAGDATYILEGSADNRVVCIPNDPNGKDAKYRQTANAADLPTNFGPYTSGVFPAPFGERTYFWSKFGERVANALNVPVFIMNAAWGGTSLEHWAKSSQGQPMAADGHFPGWHDDSFNFPYANVKNALSRYVSLTGVRAILCDHGQNDWPQTDADKITINYKTWVQQAKNDVGDLDLAFVINRQTPFRNCPAVRTAQQRVIDETVGGFAGPDYDAVLTDSVDRYDNIHLTIPGQVKAAQAWADAVTTTDFLTKSRPFQPKPVPETAVTPVSPAPTPVIKTGDVVGYQPLKTSPFALNTSFVLGMGLVVLLLAILAFALRPRVTVENPAFEEPLFETE